MIKTEPSKKDLRSFGLILAGAFGLIIGPWPLLRHQPVRLWALILAGTLFLLGGLAPSLLRLPYKGWMWAGNILGWINTRIILGAVFYLLITPLGLFRRLLGKDPLSLKKPQGLKDYRQPLKVDEAASMERQF